MIIARNNPFFSTTAQTDCCRCDDNSSQVATMRCLPYKGPNVTPWSSTNIQLTFLPRAPHYIQLSYGRKTIFFLDNAQTGCFRGDDTSTQVGIMRCLPHTGLNVAPWSSANIQLTFLPRAPHYSQHVHCTKQSRFSQPLRQRAASAATTLQRKSR